MQNLVTFTYRQETSGQANPLKGVMIDGGGAERDLSTNSHCER